MHKILILLAITSLSACGPRVSGAMAQACMDGGRSAANPALCNCVQRVANQQLSRSDERQIIRFFEDPERAQSVKISDSRGNDAFWDRYRAFTRAAERSCRR